MNADLQAIVDALNAERYGGAWWMRRAAEDAQERPAPDLTADELEYRRGLIRRRALETSVDAQESTA